MVGGSGGGRGYVGWGRPGGVVGVRSPGRSQPIERWRSWARFLRSKRIWGSPRGGQIWQGTRAIRERDRFSGPCVLVGERTDKEGSSHIAHHTHSGPPLLRSH